jgi:hypothetical protein
MRLPAEVVPMVHRLHLPSVVVIGDAVHQRRDPVRIELQGRHLLPQAQAALPIGAHDLGIHQLAGEQEHQLLLLAVRKAQLPGCRRFGSCRGAALAWVVVRSLDLLALPSRRVHRSWLRALSPI